MEAGSRPPLSHRTSRFIFTCPPVLRDRIMREAIRQGMPGAVLVRQIVKRHLDAVDAKRGVVQ